MFKKNLLVGFAFICTSAVADIIVSTTIYPLYSIVKEVGKDKIVKSLKIQNKIFDINEHVKLKNTKHDHNNSTIDPHYWVSLSN